MPNIIVRDLSFSYAERHSDLFNNLSFTLSSTWRCALVGRNGRGKTTLLRLLDGQLVPQAGQIDLPLASLMFPGRANHAALSRDAAKTAAGPYGALEAQIRKLSQRTDTSSLDQLNDTLEHYEAIEGYEIDAAIERELQALHVDGLRPMAQLSSGEQTRVLLAGLFARKQVFPLIDEPTNHLDRAGRKLVARYLAAKSGYLLVSHDRDFIDQCCDHVMGLNRVDTRIIQGNYSEYRRELDRDNERELRTNVRLKKDIRRLKQAAGERRSGALAREREKGAHNDRGYIGHKAAKQMQRALNIERRKTRAVAQTEGLLQNLDKVRALKLTSTGRKVGTTLCQVNNLGFGFGDTQIARDISFELQVGERILVSGPNGAGKSCLLKTLMGRIKPFSGNVRWSPGVTWQRLCQQPDAPFTPPTDWHLFRQVLGVLGVSGDVIEATQASNTQLFQTADKATHRSEKHAQNTSLSEGQLKKIELAYSFLQPVDLLIWDEPLNFIDLETREQLLALILQTQPTMLLVEHDTFFTKRCTTRELSLVADHAAT